MHTYESLFITPPTLDEDAEKATVETMAKIIADGGGSMVANERMGRRRLAYPILKHVDGVYVRFLYDAEAAVPKELERRMRLSEHVLRVLTVRLERDWAEAAKKQAVIDAQARVEAAERERLEQEAVAERIARGEPAEGVAAPKDGPPSRDTFSATQDDDDDLDDDDSDDRD